MQDEINEKSINLAVRIGKITADELRKTFDKIIADLEEKRANPEKVPEQPKESKDPKQQKEPKNPKEPKLKHGKQTLKQLHKHNDGLSSIELKDPNLRQLLRETKKNDIDFSVMKDGKGKYTLFFKGRNTEEMTNAFKRYANKTVNTAEKKSIKLDLKIAKSVSQEFNRLDREKYKKQRSRIKIHSKGARDR